MQITVNYEVNDEAFIISFQFSFKNSVMTLETSRLQFISIVEARRLPKCILHCFLHTSFLALLGRELPREKENKPIMSELEFYIPLWIDA